VPEVAVDLAVDDFEIGKSRVTARAPRNEALAAIN
jgi:hypothetical protein